MKLIINSLISSITATSEGTVGDFTKMFPLSCLSFLLLSAVVVHCKDDKAETLIELKGDKLESKELDEVLMETSLAEPAGVEENELRNLNKDFDRLGKIYVAQYYMLFDNPSKRLSLVSLYHSEDSFLTFEGERFKGTRKILAKFEQLKLGKVERSINSVDSQPLLDGGVIVNVVGKVKADNEPSRFYAQTFVFKPQKGSFFLQHDIFRVVRDEDEIWLKHNSSSSLTTLIYRSP